MLQEYEAICRIDSCTQHIQFIILPRKKDKKCAAKNMEHILNYEVRHKHRSPVILRQKGTEVLGTNRNQTLSHMASH
jgi:hypothetical protein